MQLITHSFDVGSTQFSRSYCVEHWPNIPNGRLWFSFIICCLQLLLPSIIVSFAHLAIQKKLNSLPSYMSRLRLYRTQRLLKGVVVVFIVSWLPLNIINLFLDLKVDKMLGWGFDNLYIDIIQHLFQIISE